MFTIGPLDMKWRPRYEAAWLWKTGDKTRLFCFLSLKNSAPVGDVVVKLQFLSSGYQNHAEFFISTMYSFPHVKTYNYTLRRGGPLAESASLT